MTTVDINKNEITMTAQDIDPIGKEFAVKYYDAFVAKSDVRGLNFINFTITSPSTLFYNMDVYRITLYKVRKKSDDLSYG